MTDLANLRYEDFEPHLNSSFTITVEGLPPLAAPLIDVTWLGQSQTYPEGMRRPFSLLFRVETPVYLQQQIYSMTHPEMGEMALFLVPVAQHEKGFDYEAVFS